MAALVPGIKQGTLKKYSRGGIMKNWQLRYFVLNQGKLSYYSKEAERYPFGEDLKGELVLYQATVSTDRKKVFNDKQIHIAGANGEKDLLIEAESAQEVWSWVEAFTQHIRYCSTRGSMIDNPGVGMSSSTVERDVSYVRADASVVSNAPGGTEQPREGSNESAVPIGSSEQQTVTPSPGFVIKALRTTGEKIFVNLCEAAEVPMTPLSLSIGFNKWPFLLLSPARTIVEEKEGSAGTVEISVYDAIVNPQVIAIAQKNCEAKDATCARVLRLLKKQYGEDLQEDYKLPKINRRYKGEIQPFLMPVDISLVCKTRSSYHAVPVNTRRGSTLAAMRRASALPSSQPQPQQAMPAPPPAPASAPAVGGTSSLERKVTKVEGYGGLARTNSVEVTPSPAISAILSNDTQKAASTAAPSMANPRGSVLTRQLTEPVAASGSGLNSMTSNERKASTVKGVKSVAVQRRRSEGGNFENTSPTMSIDMERMSPAQKLFYGVDVEHDRRNSSLLVPYYQQRTSSGGGHHNSMDSIQEETPLSSLHDDHNGAPRLVIPFQVTRQNGTFAKARPDKYSLGKNLSNGAKVFVMVRRSLPPDNAAWLRSTEGWICERPYVGSTYRVCAPCLHGQPTHIKVVTTRFEDVDNPISAVNFRASSVGKRDQSVSGWNAFRPSAFDDEGNGPAFQTRFFFDIFFPDRAFIRVSRTLVEVLTLRNTLITFPDKMTKDRALKAGDICVTRDGDGKLVKDVHWLLECVEGVEGWLTRLVQTLSIEKCRCRAWSDFLSPTAEIDLPIMEAMLMQKKGLMEAWSEIERELEIHQSQIREE